MADETLRQKMQTSLANWHTPEAADRIAQAILEAVGKRSGSTQSALTTKAPERPFGLLERSRA